MSFMYRDILNILNTLRKRTILITLNYWMLVLSIVRFNRNGKIATKSIIFMGEKIKLKRRLPNDVQLTNLRKYSVPKKINKYNSRY